MIYNFLSDYLSIIIFLFIALFLIIENYYQMGAGVTGLEPATSCVTGRRSNQAELHPLIQWWAVKDSNL